MEITYNDVKLSAEKVVAEVGRKHVYTDPLTGAPAGTSEIDCWYEYQGAPQCIVGYIGHMLKFEHVFQKIEGEGPDVLDGLVEITADALLFLEYIQRYQDEGTTWGESFDAAVSDVELNENVDGERPVL